MAAQSKTKGAPPKTNRFQNQGASAKSSSSSAGNEIAPRSKGNFGKPPNHDSRSGSPDEGKKMEIDNFTTEQLLS
eukprot:271979-Karenia_brevis.AAC.1